MKYVVIGGSGFIGSNIIQEIALYKSYKSIINIDCTSTTMFDDRVTFHQADICKDDISTPLKDADAVFLLAAKIQVQESIDNPLLYNTNNVSGLLNVLEQCRLNGVRRVIFSSSASVYGNTTKLPIKETTPVSPLSPYALQKYIGENYCQLYSNIYDLETVCLRYFNVYGKNMPDTGSYSSVISVFNRLKMRNKPLTVYGTGEQRRDFVYVRDVARANILAGTSAAVGGGDIINIGTQISTSVIELAKTYNQPIDFLPERLEPKDSIADITRAKALLDWKPSSNIKEWLISH